MKQSISQPSLMKRAVESCLLYLKFEEFKCLMREHVLQLSPPDQLALREAVRAKGVCWE